MADYLDKDGLSYFWEKIKAIFATKQDTLVSGENIKTINNNSLLGSGNIDIQSGGGDVTDVEVNGVSVVDQDGVAEIDLTGKQDTLVSGTNIKTVNNNSLLGSGNINIHSNTWVGTCPTSYSTSAKVVTTYTGDFSLVTGNIVIVQFSYYSTASPMTLNVDNTGAVAIKEYGTTDLPARWWRTKGVVPFMYDGTNFVVVDGVLATETYYGKTKLNSSVSSSSTTESATPYAVRQAYNLANSKQDELVSGTNIKTVNNTSLLGSGNIDVEGVPHVNLTQAEYDALTPAQKDNGNIYFITDGDDTAYSGIIGSGELATDAKTLVGAINELDAQIPSLVDSGLISTGFVAPANGMVKLHCTSGGGSNWYYTSVGYICMTGGLTQEASFPISKGETFSVINTNDSSRVWARYYKFSMS